MNVIYGKNACIAVLKTRKREIFEILLSREKKTEYSPFIDEKLSKYVKIVDLNYLKKITQEDSKHQGIAISCGKFNYTQYDKFLNNLSKKDDFTIFALDMINDPHNLGAIIRSAYGFGVDMVVLQSFNSCQVNETVARTSAGYSEYLDILSVSNLNQFIYNIKKLDFFTAALDVNHKKNITIKDFASSFTKKCFVFGSEGLGVSDLILKNSDYSIKIDMKNDCESLNLSNTAAIVGYECSIV